jgi:hypothetical protein
VALAPILDPKIPFLAAALDLQKVQVQLQAVIPDLRQVRAARLVRHIHISTRIPDRRPYTEAILTLCEQRLRAMAKASLKPR